MAVLRAREAIILRSIRHESRIRQIGRRIHKRFRSWTQQRTRKYWMPQKVSLHAPVDIMDSWSISAVVQKAATVRKHDSHMWYNFGNRVIELAPTLCPQQIGYIYYGYGKSRFYNKHFYEKISEYSAPLLSNFPSSSLMCVVWCLSRLQLRQTAFLNRLASVVADKFDSLRTTDLMKICDGLARLDITTPYLKQQIADKMIGRLDSLYAQDFRNAMNDVTLFHMYDEKNQIYIMERFPRYIIHL
uniref:Secretory protein, putative n=1 Tax=Babesia bovis TaxID=5865 RepID=S6BEG9_BABBO|nr:secretory protein, putative [Babesia bovis]